MLLLLENESKPTKKKVNERFGNFKNKKRERFLKVFNKEQTGIMDENELKGMKLKLGFWIVPGEEEDGACGEANLLSEAITFPSPIVNIT